MAGAGEKPGKQDKTKRSLEVRGYDRARGRSSSNANKSAPPKAISALQRFLKAARENRKVLKALGLGESPSDQVLMKALEAPDLELLFLDEGIKLEHAALICELHKEAKKEMAATSNKMMKKMWKLVLLALLALAAVVALVALVSFIMSSGWEKGNCAFQEFTNRTCNHGNACKLQVAVNTPKAFYVYTEFTPPVVNKPGSGLQFFETDAFKCCNHAKQALQGADISNIEKEVEKDEMGLGDALGSGTPCCSFYDAKTYLFCDNWGEISELQHDCPRAPWPCWAKSGGTDSYGDAELQDLKVYHEPLHQPLMTAVLIIMIAEAVVFLLGLLALSTSSLLRSAKQSQLVQDVFIKLDGTVKGRLQQKLTIQEAWQLELDGEELPSGEAPGDDSASNASESSDGAEVSQKPSRSSHTLGSDSVDICKLETDMPKTPGSRPATKSLSSMMRPIVEPVKPRRHYSQKKGLDASFSSGFAPSATASSGFGMSTTSSFWEHKADTPLRPLSARAIGSLSKSRGGPELGDSFDPSSRRPARGRGLDRARGRGGPRSAWEQPVRGRGSPDDRPALQHGVQVEPRLSQTFTEGFH
mmetsp:Transcript_77035/g.135876  ORF Transcript_77035/g.135876 Transcript_77035/m.135876 type:complete len:586 (-) Transcript_77035:105-1862(-)|eukprot:CAMPEP_0197631430 /NCGR_PEP_ID=MMETSP1338-20131121/8589_1 /TAXON_ID=43686 ORGANISM="Pelagodinium beii, Strain RCC1491" /NCGR_SAMPLE_ID=MMETSP1338 /ASSEMBLY_ACC=CAM_ASM_000754 /LENGTH=585 /DNA_ID=CAMNT_0043202869 /DNA_START=18 /DNA_END=1775 /DNA_ORIENTATION=-